MRGVGYRGERDLLWTHLICIYTLDLNKAAIDRLFDIGKKSHIYDS